MKALGFHGSKLHPGVYWHPHRDVLVVSHVDDLLVGGPEKELLLLRQQLQAKYDVKGSTLKEGHGQLKFLGRIIRAMDDRYEWCGDPKHAETLFSEWGMHDCRPVDTPITELEDPSVRESWEPMDTSEAALYRRTVAIVNYMSQDRPDLGVAANYLSRTMAPPRKGDERHAKRVIRYLRGRPVCHLLYHFQEEPEQVNVVTDSDWAGCKVTRRSTSGIIVRRGSHLIAFSCRMQKMHSTKQRRGRT